MAYALENFPLSIKLNTVLHTHTRAGVLPSSALLYCALFFYCIIIIVIIFVVYATNSRRPLDRKRYLFQTWTRRMRRMFFEWWRFWTRCERRWRGEKLPRSCPWSSWWRLPRAFVGIFWARGGRWGPPSGFPRAREKRRRWWRLLLRFQSLKAKREQELSFLLLLLLLL